MIFGVSIQTAYLVNGLYLFILFVGVFFTAETIAGKMAAFVSVFLVATFPAIIAYSRDFLFVFPLAALTSLSYLFLLKSDSFAVRKHSVLFGICVGLSVLTKTMGIVFFVVPFLYGLYLFLRGSKEIRKNVICAFLSAFCVASVYYIPNFKQIFGYLFYYGVGTGSQNFNQGVSDMFSLKYWTIYFRDITYRGISVPYLFIFIASTVAFLFTTEKKLSRAYWILWMWFICGYFLLSIPQNKGAEQYAMPLLPPLALLTAVHLSKISSKTVKYIMLTLALVTGITNYVYQTNSERCLYDSFVFKGIPVLIPGNSICASQDAIGVRGQWAITPLLQYMDNLNTNKSGIVRVLAAVDHNFLNINNLRLYAMLDKLKERVSSEFQFEVVAYKPSDEEGIKQLMRENDFIITKTGYQGPDFSNANNSIVKNLLANQMPLKSFAMTDGSVVSVYNSYHYDVLEKLPVDIKKPIEVNYGNKIKLKGIVIDRPDKQHLKVSCYWQILDDLGSFKVFIHFTDRDNKILFQSEHSFNPKSLNELKNKLINETYIVDIPEFAVGKEIFVKVGFYSQTDPQRLSIKSTGKILLDDSNTRAIVETFKL
ncbi:MAG: glycosyltransferase family 39 protein [Dissulfurispiraceae bacterium]